MPALGPEEDGSVPVPPLERHALANEIREPLLQIDGEIAECRYVLAR